MGRADEVCRPEPTLGTAAASQHREQTKLTLRSTYGHLHVNVPLPVVVHIPPLATVTNPFIVVLEASAHMV